jgi:hypothetical protein
MKLHRTNIYLYAGDLERLGQLYRNRKPSEVIRELLHKHIQMIEDKLKEKGID